MFTRYASGRGTNPVDLLAAVTEPTTGALAWAATRVSLTRVGPPDGRLVLFAGGVSGFLNRSPRWVNAQRYLMGSVLGLLALRILNEKKPT